MRASGMDGVICGACRRREMVEAARLRVFMVSMDTLEDTAPSVRRRRHGGGRSGHILLMLPAVRFHMRRNAAPAIAAHQELVAMRRSDTFTRGCIHAGTASATRAGPLESGPRVCCRPPGRRFIPSLVAPARPSSLVGAKHAAGSPTASPNSATPVAQLPLKFGDLDGRCWGWRGACLDTRGLVWLGWVAAVSVVGNLRSGAGLAGPLARQGPQGTKGGTRGCNWGGGLGCLAPDYQNP